MSGCYVRVSKLVIAVYGSLRGGGELPGQAGFIDTAFIEFSDENSWLYKFWARLKYDLRVFGVQSINIFGSKFQCVFFICAQTAEGVTGVRCNGHILSILA
ncbi:hypothetical protein D3C85_1310940 [compost metagenome]